MIAFRIISKLEHQHPSPFLNAIQELLSSWKYKSIGHKFSDDDSSE